MARVELVETPRAAVPPAPATRPDDHPVGTGSRRTDAATARATAIIPARGGSVGLPGKNLARVGGVPLIARAVRAALAADRIDRVVVSTDDSAIADAARAAGASVVDRPAQLSGSAASSESALLHALDELELRDALGPLAPGPLGGRTGVEGGDERRPGAEHPVTVFIQATSPFIDPADLDAAIARVASGQRDVVFSGALSHVFLWRDDADADSAVGVNHEASRRLRRQEREPEYLETGAFYVFATDGFRAAGHRFFGRIGIQPVDPDHAIEIDDLADLERARALAAHVDRGLAASARPGAARGALDAVGPRIDVDALVTDFDGVHTDDTVMVDQLGRESVRVSRSDGAGIARLRKAGLPVLILSAEQNPVVGRRAEKLGVECVQGVEEKGAVLREWAGRRGIRLDRIAYLGNDRGDLPALELVGWPIAVPDAAAEALAAARHVLTSTGGHGAVRELADLILAARDTAAANDDPDPASARS
ncbi:N-acylneuraminate cytidylyltransferase [Agromyces hippuratus]|uniref:N-acylneuraminate cytidylyltransferase n=1 Tax=Agromyces hippuratus TaxID=286438 RepID=A0A852WX24_9MICO|nr:NTP transferase domain-containing protein [Agromyces hippuratus]NYG20810.1 N-acylneuraminate cytidylyltransferase [Agromyces hippuratus]